MGEITLPYLAYEFSSLGVARHNLAFDLRPGT